MTNLEDFQVKEIADTLRLVANRLNSKKRTTCLDRDIMVCWNWCVDALNDVDSETTANNGIDYRLKTNQVPGPIKNEVVVHDKLDISDVQTDMTHLWPGNFTFKILDKDKFNIIEVNAIALACDDRPEATTFTMELHGEFMKDLLSWVTQSDTTKSKQQIMRDCALFIGDELIAEMKDVVPVKIEDYGRFDKLCFTTDHVKYSQNRRITSQMSEIQENKIKLALSEANK